MAVFCPKPEGSLCELIAKAFSVCCGFDKGYKGFFAAEFKLMSDFVFSYGTCFIQLHSCGHRTAHRYGVEPKFIADEVCLIYYVNVVYAAVRTE